MINDPMNLISIEPMDELHKCDEYDLCECDYCSQRGCIFCLELHLMRCDECLGADPLAACNECFNKLGGKDIHPHE